jgi:hypothetical protein
MLLLAISVCGDSTPFLVALVVAYVMAGVPVLVVAAPLLLSFFPLAVSGALVFWEAEVLVFSHRSFQVAVFDC